MSESLGEKLVHELHERVSKVDAHVKNPAERALKVWNKLYLDDSDSLTDWDLVCFAVEYLGFMSTVFPFIAPEAKRLNVLVYKAHYMNSEWQSEHKMYPPPVNKTELDNASTKRETIRAESETEGS